MLDLNKRRSVLKIIWHNPYQGEILNAQLSWTYNKVALYIANNKVMLSCKCNAHKEVGQLASQLKVNCKIVYFELTKQ